LLVDVDPGTRWLGPLLSNRAPPDEDPDDQPDNQPTEPEPA
jgi:hypothetical protein